MREGGGGGGGGGGGVVCVCVRGRQLNMMRRLVAAMS